MDTIQINIQFETTKITFDDICELEDLFHNLGNSLPDHLAEKFTLFGCGFIRKYDEDKVDNKSKEHIKEHGTIPANVRCPFRSECNTKICGGDKPKDKEYSCAMARGLAM